MKNKKPAEVVKTEKPVSGNEIVVNAADFKFSDFSNSVLTKVDASLRDENWCVKFRELDAKIHNAGLNNSVNFSDDRLVLVGYKAMIRSDVFSTPSLREWWLVNRYLDIYASKDVAMIDTLRKVVNMHTAFAFSKAQASDEQKEEMKQYFSQLSKVVYEDGYIELPQFVLDVIEEKKVRRKKGETAQYDFSADEAAQWKGLRDTAELMLSDKDSLTEEELKMWQGALDTANIMLD